MNEKQKRFCAEYILDPNATQSAIRAGYSKNAAYNTGSRLLKDAEIKNCINEKLSGMSDDTIADASEVLRYLSSVMRGEDTEEVVVVEGIGQGRSKARKIKKAAALKDKLKAGELLGKRYQIFTENQTESGNVDGFVKAVSMEAEEISKLYEEKEGLEETEETEET